MSLEPHGAFIDHGMLYTSKLCIVHVELIRVLLYLLAAILRFPATNLEGRQNWIEKDHPLVAAIFCINIKDNKFF